MILRSRIWLYAVMVESLAMPFVTKIENRSPIRKQGIYSTVRLTTSLRRRACGQAPAGVRLRLPPVGKNSLPHRPLIVKRLSRHKRREYIALADPRDEKRNCLQKPHYIPTFWSRIKKTTLSFAKKIVFLKRHKNVDHIVTVQIRTVIFFAVCAKKFTKSSYIALFPGLFS